MSFNGLLHWKENTELRLIGTWIFKKKGKYTSQFWLLPAQNAAAKAPYSVAQSTANVAKQHKIAGQLILVCAADVVKVPGHNVVL